MTDDFEQLPPVEFLDQITEERNPEELLNTADPRGRSIGLALAALVIVGAGLAALTSDDAAVGPSTTPTTVPQPETTSTVDRDTTPTTTGIGAGNTPTAIIGDGPELTWVPLPSVPAMSRRFSWTGDAFVSTDGVNEWIIRPTADGADTLIEQRPGPLGGDRIGRQRIDAAGADAWLAPDDTVEVAIDGEVSVVTLEPLRAPNIDIGMPTTEHHVAVNDRVIAVVRSIGFRVDDDALVARLGPSAEDLGRIDFVEVGSSSLSLYGRNDSATFPLDELDLTDDEVEWLRRVNVNAVTVEALDRATGEITSTRFEDEGRITSVHVYDQTLLATSFNYSYRSTDGLAWERRSLPSGPVSLGVVDGQLLALDYSDRFPRVARSTDFGLTWSSTDHPFVAAIGQAGTGDLVLATGWGEPQPDVDEWTATRNGYRLDIFESFSSFQLFGPEGELLTEGFVGDPDSGFVFGFDNVRFRWVDPATGIEAVVLESADLFRGFAAALTEQGHPMVIGAARWPDGSDDPVWRVSDVQEMFGPSALSVTFIAGSDHILAIVGTTEGERLYLAPIDPA